MRKCGDYFNYLEGSLAKIIKYARRSPQYAKCDLIYLNDLYPALCELHFLQSKNIPLISYVDFFSQNLPLPVNQDFIVESLALSLEFNNVDLFLNRGVVYLQCFGERKPPANARQYSTRNVMDYLRQRVQRSASEIKGEEKKVFSSGFDNIKTANNIGLALHAIILPGNSGGLVSKESLKQNFNLSERDYSKVRQLFKNIVNDDLISGKRLQLIQPTNKGLQRIITPSFTLTTQNLRKLEHYAFKMNKTTDQTLNRLVHDFFSLLEKQQRLDKFVKR